MQIGRILGATRVLGKSQGYVPLPVRDEIVDGVPIMSTAWFPTPEQLSDISRGAPIILRVVGTAHPPVRLDVGEPPEPA